VTQTLSDKFSLGGKAALVTGGGRGIGRATCEALAAAGAAVAVADLDHEAAVTVAKAIEADGGRAVPLGFDAADEASIVDGVAEAARQLGRLDILVNNAGIYPYYTLADMETELFDQVHGLNVRGVFLCLREAVKAMRATGDGGVIVNLASIAAFVAGQPGLAAYGTSKAAVVQLTRNAGLELADEGIRVVAVAPGFIETGGTQDIFDAGMGDVILAHQAMKRVGQPEDIAWMIVALAGPAAGFVTGTTVVVDGGFLLV
jgi:NAD(P)-dependent dehydrogenase (short-subunit alcohol dehydrogenase family)